MGSFNSEKALHISLPLQMASNRSIQWREQVIDPLFESLPDHTIMYKLAKKLGFADELTKSAGMITGVGKAIAKRPFMAMGAAFPFVAGYGGYRKGRAIGRQILT